MYTASDFQFGAPGWTGWGMPAGASNPAGAYVQAAASNINTPAPAMGVGGVSGVGAPAVSGGQGGGFFGGMNGMDAGKLILGGLQTIGNIWQAWEANKLAKEQFKFSKDFANTNLANQIQSYNTQVDNIGRSRAFTEGQSTDEAAAWLLANRLPKADIK